MAYNNVMSVKKLLSVAPLFLLVGCGWVDATGRESNTAPVTQISFNDGQQSAVTQVSELDPTRIRASSTDVDGRITRYVWSENPVRQGALSECTSAPDFDISIAADSMRDACSIDSECSLSIEQQADSLGDGADFLISAPDISAPIGLTYELTTVDNDGGGSTQRTTFCLIAVNEAPEAVDDSYTVLEGESLVVNTAARSLVHNDIDDKHVLNEGLTVLLEPKREPSMATLALRSDGGFTFTPTASAANIDTIDSFEYWLTDGVHEPVFATVTVRIVAIDDPPEQLEPIPLLEAVAGIPFEFDVAPYFEDPEGSNLSFAVVGGSLPQSGALTFSSGGVISGTAELFDEGSYAVSVAASDGSSGVSADINLVVLENRVVEAVSISAQNAAAGEEFTIDVSDFFDDPENQPLTYSVDVEYSSAELDMDAETGILSAEFEDDRRYTIDVSASDGVSEPTSIRFVIIVTLDNSTPIFRGTIANQTIEEGELILPVSGLFSDPDGDTLEFEVLGTLPAGLSLSAAGVLSGRPLVTGRFSSLRLIATDPFGEFARSNAFTIQVLPAPVPVPVVVNTAPEFVEDTVFNQGIVLGQGIRAVRPEFIDADDDVLSYSVIGGTLPLGVTINTATGVVSGTPLAIGWERDLQVLATDPFGASATSDEFWIRVR